MEITRADVNAQFMWTVIRAAHRIESDLTALFTEHGLTPVQFGVLVQLGADAALTNAELARRCEVRPQTMTAVVDGLVGRELITRSGPGGRGRRTDISLTRAGRRVLGRVWPAFTAANRAREFGAAAVEVRAANALLHRIIDGDGTVAN